MAYIRVGLPDDMTQDDAKWLALLIVDLLRERTDRICPVSLHCEMLLVEQQKRPRED